MTGEITLRGRVLPVGGLRSKLLAAQRYGMEEVILPKENEAQVSEIPANEIQGLKLRYVESISEAMTLLFPATGGTDRPSRTVSPEAEPARGAIPLHAAH
ncbi:MAG: hypothetical protein A3I06_02820 [Candidatus Lindowbacteria bacterium RIFCSPLOWO2_02_FULL_62_12]|nr:MAG: hypothetical protein A3I06_02820 [Candidatus Lindowbacteria bacterium RIFCSPLOWO2_02_FULL_62_12]